MRAPVSLVLGLVFGLVLGLALELITATHSNPRQVVCQLFEMMEASYGRGRHTWFCYTDIQSSSDFYIVTWLPIDIFKISKRGSTWVRISVPLESDDELVIGENIPEQANIEHVQQLEPHGRRATPAGEQHMLVVRINALDKQFEYSATELSDSVFGTHGDKHNAVTQYEACSHGDLILRPYEHPLAVDGVIEIDIDANVINSGRAFMQRSAQDALRATLGSSVMNAIDLILYAIPGGSKDTNGKGWGAYAFLNTQTSVYSGSNIMQLSIVMHEVGHCFGLHHSGQNNNAGDFVEYGDNSCVMGVSHMGSDKPLECFNGAKTYQLGWFQECVKTVTDWDSDTPTFYRLVATTDYVDGCCIGNQAVVIRIETSTTTNARNLFVSYNRAKGYNLDTGEFKNNVMVVESEDDRGMSTVLKGLSTSIDSLPDNTQYTYVTTDKGDVRIEFCYMETERAVIAIGRASIPDMCTPT